MARVAARIDVDDRAFLAGIPPAIEEWRLDAYGMVDHVADKVVARAKELVAKLTGTLASTIVRGALVVTRTDAYVQIAAGDGTRYALYQEFGTHKMKAHPFMRPALAMGAGVLRAAGFAVRTVTTSKTRAAVKRAAHRQKLRRAVQAGYLTHRQAGAESKRISSLPRRFRG